MSDTELSDAVAKQAIRDLSMLYCRAVDRLDEEILPRVFHPDATVEFGTYNGPTSGFVDNTFAHLRTMERTYHCIGNQLIEVGGDTATGEIYVFAYLTIEEDQGPMDTLLVGRYLDRYERRDGVWKIAHRMFVMDWNQNEPNTSEWDEGMYGDLKARGRRDRSDSVYTFLK